MRQFLEKTSRITSGELRKFSLEVRAPSRRDAANEFSKAILAYLIYVQLLADREFLYRVSAFRERK